MPRLHSPDSHTRGFLAADDDAVAALLVAPVPALDTLRAVLARQPAPVVLPATASVAAAAAGKRPAPADGARPGKGTKPEPTISDRAASLDARAAAAAATQAALRAAVGTAPPPAEPTRKATRWNIPPHALQLLEKVFQENKFPSVETRRTIAADLKVKPRQVQTWFQNKRQRLQAADPGNEQGNE